MGDRCYRASINSIPEDQSKLRDSKIPLFFSVEFEKETVPVPQLTMPLERCEKCKGYLNPYAEIIMPGLKWRCNLCDGLNTPQAPFQMMDRSVNEHPGDALANAAFNRAHFPRSDLCSDVYEAEAPDSFNIRTSPAPTLCFVLDASIEAQKAGLLGSVVDAVQEILRSVDYDPRAKACFIFYNELAYVLRRDKTMLAVSGDIPLLIPDSVAFPLAEVPLLIDGFRNEVFDKYFGVRRSVHSNVLLPLQFVHTTFRSATVFLFLAAKPNYGQSAIKESAKLICNSPAYKSTAERLFVRNIGVCLFLLSRANVEYPTLSILPQLTGGCTYYHPNFDGSDSVCCAKLFSDLSGHLNRNIGYGAVCKIRTSDGAVLRAFYGNHAQKKADIFGFANWDPAHSINFSLTLFNNVRSALYAQVAMIRVTKTGKRLIRVFNICTPVQAISFYSGCDSLAIAHCMALDAFYYESRKAGSGGDWLKSSLESVWKELYSQNGRVPPNLESLPSLVLALRKTIPLRPDSATPMDFRAFYIYSFLNLYTKIVDLMLYPLLISINDSCTTPLALSTYSLTPGGFFILDSGINLFFFVAKDCDQSIITQLFNDPVSGPIVFAPPENELSRYVSELLVYLTGGRPQKPRFILVLDNQSTIYSRMFYSYMYDDNLHLLPSIDDYKRELEGLGQ